MRKDVGLGQYGCTADECPFASTKEEGKYDTCESVTIEKLVDQNYQINKLYNSGNGSSEGREV